MTLVVLSNLPTIAAHVLMPLISRALWLPSCQVSHVLLDVANLPIRTPLRESFTAAQLNDQAGRLLSHSPRCYFQLQLCPWFHFQRAPLAGRGHDGLNFELFCFCWTKLLAVAAGHAMLIVIPVHKHGTT